jgi:predicted NodU family carbamoyl transferase/MoaA/NifB/PqqE/SkfB family radical SAM enzyme
MNDSQTRYVLGTVISDHDSAACLLKDGKLIAAIGEERICRVRRGDPRNSVRRAVEYVLAAAGIKIDRVDLIVCDGDHYYPKDAKPVPVFPDFPRPDDIVQLDHHIGHIASAFFPSPFDEAAVLTVDASGDIDPIVTDKFHRGLLAREVEFRDRGFISAHENPLGDTLNFADYGGRALDAPAESLTLSKILRGEKIHELDNLYAPGSLGYFYALCSDFLDMEEGSFMGLSSHGGPTEFVEKIKQVVLLQENGRILINPDYLHFCEGKAVFDNPVDPSRLTEKFFTTFGKGRKYTEEIAQRDKDFAWAAQNRLEQALVHVAKHLHEISGSDNLCIGGGVGLNSVANKVVLDETPFRKIFVQPAASDDGIALGNALFGNYVLEGLPKTRAFDMGDACLGKSVEEAECEAFLQEVSAKRLPIEYVPSLPFIEKVEILYRFKDDGDYLRAEMKYDDAANLYRYAIETDPYLYVEYVFEVTAAHPDMYESKIVKTKEPQAAKVPDPVDDFIQGHLDMAGRYNEEAAYIGPEHVTIDPTNRCDNNCIGCFTRSPLLGEFGATESWRRQQMSSERLLSLIDELADLGTRRIRLTGGGEPFVHPASMEALRKIKQRGMIAAVTTNFSALTDKKVDELAEIGVDELTVSLWAGSPDVYSRGHPNKTAGTFFWIEKALARYCGNKAPHSKVILANVVFAMNHMETPMMLDLALRVGADGVYFTVVDSTHERTEGLLLTPPHIARLETDLVEVKKRVDQVNAEGREFLLDNFHGFLRRIRSDGVQTGDYDKHAVDAIPCYIGWLFCRILPDGGVSPCCRGVDKLMGNVNKASFADIWNSRAYKDFRRMALREKKGHPYFHPIGCHRACDNLMHNEMFHTRLAELTDEQRRRLVDYARKTGR